MLFPKFVETENKTPDFYFQALVNMMPSLMCPFIWAGLAPLSSVVPESPKACSSVPVLECQENSPTHPSKLKQSNFFFNKFIYFIYLFLAVLGFRSCAWALSRCGEWGLLFVAVHRLLIAVASLVVEHGL